MLIRFLLTCFFVIFFNSTLFANQVKYIEGRLEVVGAITRPVNGEVVGILVLKDINTRKTFAVEIGKTFLVDTKVLRITGVGGKSVYVTDGTDTAELSYHAGRFSESPAGYANQHTNRYDSTTRYGGTNHQFNDADTAEEQETTDPADEELADSTTTAAEIKFRENKKTDEVGLMMDDSEPEYGVDEEEAVEAE